MCFDLTLNHLIMNNKITSLSNLIREAGFAKPGNICSEPATNVFEDGVCAPDVLHVHERDTPTVNRISI